MTWTRAEDDDLGAIFEAVARPWPAALARLWLGDRCRAEFAEQVTADR